MRQGSLMLAAGSVRLKKKKTKKVKCQKEVYLFTLSLKQIHIKTK